MAGEHDGDEVAEVAARLLRACGARLVCVDLDATFLSVHTGGAWLSSAEALRPLVRGFFLRLIPLLAAPGGPKVALVTFSPQLELVRELLALCFAPEVAASIIVRADCAGWSVSSEDAAAFLPLWQAAGRHADRRFKLPFLISAGKEAANDEDGGGRPIRNCETVLIDDDAANVRVARDCGVLALFFDAEAAKDDAPRAERELCTALERMVKAGKDEQQPEQSPVKEDNGEKQKPGDHSPVKSLLLSPVDSKSATPLDATPPRPPSGRLGARSNTSSSRRRQSSRTKRLGLAAGTPTGVSSPSPSTRRRRVGRVLRDILNTTASSAADGASVAKTAEVVLPDAVRLLGKSETKFFVPGTRSSSSAPPTSSKASGGSSTRVTRFRLCTPSPVMKLKYTVDMGRPRSKRASRLMRSCTRSIDGELREHEHERTPTPTGILGLARTSPATSPAPSAARVMHPLFEAASPPASQ